MNTTPTKPMRYFSDQAPAPKRCLIGGKARLFIYFAAPVLAIPGLAFCGFELVERFYSEAPMAEVTPVGEISADSLIQAQFEAMGGGAIISKLDHLQFRGSVFNGDEIFTFEGTHSRAEGYAVVLSDRDSQQSIQLKGLRGIASLARLDADIIHTDYLRLALEAIFSDFDNLALHHLFDDGKPIISVERDKVGQTGLLCVTLETDPGTTSIFYLNEDSMQLAARRDLRDGQVVATFRYSDYKAVNGVPLPHSVVAQLYGGDPVRLHFRSLRGYDASSTNGAGEGLALGEINELRN